MTQSNRLAIRYTLGLAKQLASYNWNGIIDTLMFHVTEVKLKQKKLWKAKYNMPMEL